MGSRSIGSITQTAAASGLRAPRSSPRKPSFGNRRARPCDYQIFTSAVGLADEVLGPFAVDAKQLPAREVVGGDAAGLADHRFGHPQAILKIGRVKRRQGALPPHRAAGARDEPGQERNVAA
jgi:hypothetical protein